MQRTMSKQWCGDLQKLDLYKRTLFFKKGFSDVLDWGLQMGLMGCPETSVRNYHYLLRNKPKREQFSSISRRSII